MRRSTAVRLTLLPLLASAALATAEQAWAWAGDPSDAELETLRDEVCADYDSANATVPVIRGGFGGTRVFYCG